MFAKLGILFITGVLTIFIGVMMIVKSKYENSKFDNALNKMAQNPNAVAKTAASSYYNDKSNELIRYGLLAIVYGVIVAGIAGYWILAEKINMNQETVNIGVGVITVIGVIGVIATLMVTNKQDIRQ